MSSRSLNKVQLIGNLTRDPELRYTPSGTAVCTLGLATNRSWTTEAGEKKEETEFHRIVSWNKLAELCSQLLFKGRRVFVEGRLQTRVWTGQDGAQRQTTEIIIEDMIILDNRRAPGEAEEIPAAITPVVGSVAKVTEPVVEPAEETVPVVAAVGNKDQADVSVAADGQQTTAAKTQDDKKKKVTKKESGADEPVNPDDIPF